MKAFIFIFLFFFSALLNAQKELKVVLNESDRNYDPSLKIKKVKIKEKSLIVRFAHKGSKKDKISVNWTGYMARSLPPYTRIVLYTESATDAQKYVNRKVKIDIQEIFNREVAYGVKIAINEAEGVYFIEGPLKVTIP